MNEIIERHGLWVSCFGLVGGWTLQNIALAAAVLSSLATASLALYTLYLKIKKKDK